MIAFIDTEVNPRTLKVMDYGAVREDGAVMHFHSKADFDALFSKTKRGLFCSSNQVGL